MNGPLRYVDLRHHLPLLCPHHQRIHTSLLGEKIWREVDCFVNNDIRLALWNFEVTLDDDYDIKEIGIEVLSDLIAWLKPYYVLPCPHVLHAFFMLALLSAIVDYLTHFTRPVNGIGLRSRVSILVLLSTVALNSGVKGSMPPSSTS